MAIKIFLNNNNSSWPFILGFLESWVFTHLFISFFQHHKVNTIVTPFLEGKREAQNLNYLNLDHPADKQ